MKEDSPDAIAPGQKWAIDLFRPEDAPGVARLFRSVYGDGYPVKTYTVPEQLVEANASGRVISSVARTPSNDIVAHMALFRSAASEALYEVGASLVHPAYRGGMVAVRLSHFSATVVPSKFLIDALFAENVCNHVTTQKIAHKFGILTCALEVDLMPSEAYEKEASASGRVAAVLDFSIVNDKPREVYLPKAYEDALRALYEGFDGSCRFASSSAPLPEGRASRMESTIWDFARVAKFFVHEAGEDFGEALAGEEAAAVERGCVVVEVFLKLSWPWVGCMVDMLRSSGYFFGGLLPRWFDDDGLLMQKVLVRPNWDGIRLFSDRALKIMDIARADWEETNKVRGA